MEEIIIEINESPSLGEPADVTMEWNRWEQAWIISVVDANGFQIGEAEYVYKQSGKDFANEIKNDMYERYIERKEERE